MGDYVTLVGAEDVLAGSNRMAEAAREMQSAAYSIEGALARHERFMDEWLGRLVEALENAGKSIGGL